MGYYNGKKVLSVVETNAVAVDIVPNPSGSPTEVLEKIKIDNVIYGVEGGASATDNQMSDVSVNPVQNKVIKGYVDDKADEVKEDVEKGVVVAGKALSAKAIENVSEDSGSVQTDPFIFQATGTNNNTTETPTAPVAKQLELRGNSVVVNQHLELTNQTDVNIGGLTTTTNATTYRIKASGTATSVYAVFGTLRSFVAGHKYLSIANVIKNTGNKAIKLTALGVNVPGIGLDITTPGFYANIKESSYSGTQCGYGWFGLAVNDTYDFEIESRVIDLTQWYGSNERIPQDVLDHPEKFINYYQGDLPHNIGGIVDCNATELDTIGFNQWDEEFEIGKYISSDGTINNYTNAIMSKNNIEVIPNTNYNFYVGISGDGLGIRIAYYDKDNNFITTSTSGVSGYVFTTPNNCKYIKFSIYNYGTTYNHNICINLSWDGQRNGEYQAFVKHPYPLGNDVLRSAGDTYDSKAPSGLITRRIIKEQLTGNETWAKSGSGDTAFFVMGVSGRTIGTGSYRILSQGYQINDISLSNTSIGINGVLVNNHQLRIRPENVSSMTLEQFKTWLPNQSIIIQYPLEEPTTEQGTPFAENIIVDDYGTMKFVNTNGVPQGNKFFYLADYVLLLDDLNNYTDGDASKLAKKTDIANLKDYIDVKMPTPPTTEGTYLLKASVDEEGNPTYSWVSE